METLRSVNNFDYMYDALADASAGASAVSKITDSFILITNENANWKEIKEFLTPNCKALFYVGKPDAQIMFDLRSYIPLVMQTENIEEAVSLASQYKVNGVNKIIFIPGVENANGFSAQQMIEVFKNTVNNI
jgi:UDP-N-acetylmuramoylalanine-D-glutamate ligase